MQGVEDLSKEELLEIVITLKKENSLLKSEKQILINKLMNLELQRKQSDKRKAYTHKTLISESNIDRRYENGRLYNK